MKNYSGYSRYRPGHLRRKKPCLCAATVSVAFAYSVQDMVLMGRANKIGLFSKPGQRDTEAAMNALEQLKTDHLTHKPFSELYRCKKGRENPGL